MNQINITGNLTRDIEIRYTGGGMAISKTAIASTRKYTSNGERKEEVLFMDLDFFGRSAEVANQYLNKGSKILITGRVIFQQWVDNNGVKQSKHSIAVEHMEMLDTRTKAPSQLDKQPQQQSKTPTYQEQHNRANLQPKKAQPTLDIDEDEMPF